MLKAARRGGEMTRDPSHYRWNLYENPIYNSSPDEEQDYQTIHLPVSAHKMAASFGDLTFIKPSHIIDAAQTQIKAMRLSNKRLSAQVSQEKKARRLLESVCEQLALDLTACKLHMDRMRKDMEDERQRQRVAEAFREERVKMKLDDAKFLLESKLLELDRHHHPRHQGNEDIYHQLEESNNNTTNTTTTIVDNYKSSSSSSSNLATRTSFQSSAPENPHINRGIKVGFVEFQKVLQPKTRKRHLFSAGGSKLDYSKAQLSILC